MEEANKLSSQHDGEVTVDETEEYTNFVLKEIIEGRASIDDQATTQPLNGVGQEFNQALQECGQIDGFVAVNQSQPVVSQPASSFDVFGVNGNRSATESVVATYQVAGQKVVIPVVAVPAQELPIATVPQPAVIIPQAAESPATPGPSNGKKRKLYELDQIIDDPVLEKKRRNALNAKNHRDKTKNKIAALTDELESVKGERDNLSVENQLVKTEIEQVKLKAQRERDALLKEIISLREENARLRQQQNVVQQQQEQHLQQEKIGMLDLYDILSDDNFGF